MKAGVQKEGKHRAGVVCIYAGEDQERHFTVCCKRLCGGQLCALGFRVSWTGADGILAGALGVLF